jgi:hypothetical protein
LQDSVFLFYIQPIGWDEFTTDHRTTKAGKGFNEAQSKNPSSVGDVSSANLGLEQANFLGATS